jgi:hypothetical protein
MEQTIKPTFNLDPSIMMLELGPAAVGNGRPRREEREKPPKNY